MKKRVRGRASTAELLSYLDGELHVEEARAVQRATLECSESRARLTTLTVLRDALSAPVKEIDGRSLTLSIRELAERTRVPTETSRGLHVPSFASRVGWRGVSLAAAAVFVLGVGASWQRLDERRAAPAHGATSTAKSGLGDEATRWAGIQVYRVDDAGEPERLRRTLTGDEGLVFSYTNVGDDPYARLMIFAVDSARRVHWYFPASARGAASIPIERGRAEVPLPELVRSPLPEGPLRIYAAFTREPLSAEQVESWLDSHPSAGAGFAPSGAAVSRIDAQVAPDSARDRGSAPERQR